MEQEALTLRETIRNIIKKHLEAENSMVMGQCLTAVGWVGGTLPELYEDAGMIELSMSDVAGAGFAVGAALAGKRPIYVIRYQGFNWYNAPIILNYACKSKAIWGRPCPMFIRSIAMEGGIGPVAGSSHHSIYYRMPGVRIYSPMTPGEYVSTYKDFMSRDDVFYVSEHRGSYNNSEEIQDILFDSPDYVLLAISITRFAAMAASTKLLSIGIKVAVHHIFQVKPFSVNESMYRSLITSKYGGCILDDDYPDGVAKAIGFDVMSITGAKLSALGLPDRTAGFAPGVDNLPPDVNQIVEFVQNKISI